MGRIAFLFLGLLTLFSFPACTVQTTCPAFQSAFIHDDNVLKEKFSYFNTDSTPKILTASKTKYLIITSKSYRERLRNLNTLEMRQVYPQLLEDSLTIQRDDPSVSDSVTLQPSDSLNLIDSLYYEITRLKEKYNVDQDNYMWYFRKILELPDARAARIKVENSMSEYSEGDTLNTRKKKKFTFFKNLFRKKNKKDSTVVDAEVEEVVNKARSKSRDKKNQRKKKSKKAEADVAQPDTKQNQVEKEKERPDKNKEEETTIQEKDEEDGEKKPDGD